MNKVLIAGNLVKDPEVRIVGNNMKVCGFTLAVSDKNKDKTVSFIDCDAFAKTAEFIGANFVKGRQMLVEGRLKQDSWEKDGKKVSKICLKVDEVHYLQGDKTGNVPTQTQVEKPAKVEKDSKEPEYSF